jgi:hypothetical protein
VGVYHLTGSEAGHLDDGGFAVEIRCFPSADARFRDDIEGLLRAWGRDEITPDALTARAVERYPEVAVVTQSDLGRLGSRPVLYVYRDGTV